MKHFRWPVTAIVVAIVAASCSRSGSPTVATPTTLPAQVTSTTAAGPGPGDFGTLKAVCGPGTAKGATAQGVTDTAINVATMADPGATVQPGLDQELFDASTAFVDWCNAAGGILGRQITLHKRDSAIFNVALQMQAACAQDFALVGNGEAFDDQGVSTRVACGLPEMAAYDNSPKATGASLIVQATPMPIQQQPTAAWKAMKTFAPGATKIGLITGNLKGVLLTRDRVKEAVIAQGYSVVYNDTYPIQGADNWQPYLEKMKTAGVQILCLIGSPADTIAMEKAMKAIGWYPQAIAEQANQYDPRLIAEGGDAIQNTFVLVGFYPFEDAAKNPATKQMVDIIKQYVPSGKIAALTDNSWTAWLLFATAAKQCASNLTRECLLQQAGSQTAWTGGGLAGPVSTNPVNRQSPDCYAIVKATPAGWVDAPEVLPPTPGQGIFNCDPTNVMNLQGNYNES